MMTREKFVHNVRRIVTVTLCDDATREKLSHVKLLYGTGAGMGARGVTFFGAWSNGNGATDVVEICAVAEESPTQLAGTTIHELAHVVAGHKAGHGKEWKEACAALGLRRAKAAGHRYTLASFDPRIRAALAELFTLADGSPSFGMSGAGIALPKGKPRPCGAGIGTRGGTSRGKGSGSRMRLYHCECQPKPIKIRSATDTLDATCNVCGAPFVLQ